MQTMNRRMKWLMSGVLAAVLAAGIGFVVMDKDRRPERPEGTAKTTPKVREPAVAGLFYPADAADLTRTIDNLLAAAQPEPLGGELKALICPHAGYVYSGPTAAFSYKLLEGRDVDCVILLAPSHHALFEGASVCDADVYRTPLGDV
ncbi:MAG: AmmeMemoRadiSam system protein B, partial [Verrucomicrobia bacterium]|nr:AmmeMemoRadiSam system protein B [Verrucomicrobiota bacterium]